MSSPSIPVSTRPHNGLLHGPNSGVHSNLVPSAPGSTSSFHSVDYAEVSRQYGSGLSMQLRTEAHLSSLCGGRLPGLPRSNALADALTGRDTTIGFEDVLNQEGDRAEGGRVGVHGAMEVKLGL
mmetsp:Transcript_14865/g.29602  ORF Transcript_14865/g.29602 Transcript_14865/m.29602 type:complete len:124 (+) Transcript_14865:1906-2277(+)